MERTRAAGLRRGCGCALIALALATLVPLGLPAVRIPLWAALLDFDSTQVRSFAAQRLVTEGARGWRALLLWEDEDVELIDLDGDLVFASDALFWQLEQHPEAAPAVVACAPELDSARRQELIDYLANFEEDEPWRAAIEAIVLAELLDPRSEDRCGLLYHIEEPVPEAIDAAVAAIIESGPEQSSLYWLEDFEAYGPRTTEAICARALKEQSEAWQWPLYSVLLNGQRRALKPLAILSVTNPKLGSIVDPEDFDELALNAADRSCRLALELTAGNPQPSAWAWLEGELDSPDPERQRAAALALSAARLPRSFGEPLARRLLASPDAELRSRGARLLGGLPGEAAPLVPLWEAAMEDVAEVRIQALAGLRLRPLPAALRPSLTPALRGAELTRRLAGGILARADPSLALASAEEVRAWQEALATATELTLDAWSSEAPFEWYSAPPLFDSWLELLRGPDIPFGSNSSWNSRNELVAWLIEVPPGRGAELIPLIRAQPELAEQLVSTLSRAEGEVPGRLELLCELADIPDGDLEVALGGLAQIGSEAARAALLERWPEDASLSLELTILQNWRGPLPEEVAARMPGIFDRGFAETSEPYRCLTVLARRWSEFEGGAERLKELLLSSDSAGILAAELASAGATLPPALAESLMDTPELREHPNLANLCLTLPTTPEDKAAVRERLIRAGAWDVVLNTAAPSEREAHLILEVAESAPFADMEAVVTLLSESEAGCRALLDESARVLRVAESEPSLLALLARGHIARPAPRPALMRSIREALPEAWEEVRGVLLRALAQLPEDADAAVLEAALESEAEEERLAGWEWRLSRGEAGSLAQVIELAMRGERAEVREGAMRRALKELEGAERARLARWGCWDESPGVRAAAVVGLSALTEWDRELLLSLALSSQEPDGLAARERLGPLSEANAALMKRAHDE